MCCTIKIKTSRVSIIVDYKKVLLSINVLINVEGLHNTRGKKHLKKYMLYVHFYEGGNINKSLTINKTKNIFFLNKMTKKCNDILNKNFHIYTHLCV